ncbi:hypothetical protein, partial [Rhizobium leguminosarum]|uniref:hypothetical protein n=1 Tax=Rhizobium leguminosarum TaxID=384 RepID=UPI001C904999
SRRRAAPEPPDIPSLLNSPQINATIESRHYGASKPSFSTQSARSRHLGKATAQLMRCCEDD